MGFSLRTSLFRTNESFGLLTRAFQSDHRIPARVVAESESSVREASRALDSSKEGGYQRSLELKVIEMPLARCRGCLRMESVCANVVTSPHPRHLLRLGKPNLIDNRIYLPRYRK